MISKMRGAFFILEVLHETFPRIIQIVQHTNQELITFMVPVVLDKKLCEVMEDIQGRQMPYKDCFPVEVYPKSSDPYPHGDYYRIRLVNDISINVHE